MEKFKRLTATDITKSLCGLVLKEGEKSILHDICIKYNIPITYPNLFSDESHHYLWGISKTGIGLISTVIMNYLEDNNGIIFHSLDELKRHLKNN